MISLAMLTLIPCVVRVTRCTPRTDLPLCLFVLENSVRLDELAVVTIPIGIRVLQVDRLLVKHLPITPVIALPAGPSLLLIGSTVLHNLGRCGLSRAA